MGRARHGGHPAGEGRVDLSTQGRVARVIPAVPTFQMDGGFRYEVPARLLEMVAVGSLVRIPLGGRTTAGHVIAIEDGDTARLKEIRSVSGRSTTFDEALLASLAWAAEHYVSPLSTLLGRTLPPNVPPGPPPVPATSPGPNTVDAGPYVSRILERQPVPIRAVVGPPSTGVLESIAAPLLAAGRSVVVVAPTATEVEHLAEALARFDPVLVHGELADVDVTRAWAVARHHPSLLVGTPRVAGWLVHDPGVFVVVEESRRAMKDRQTPTIHVRDLVVTRARQEGFGAVFVGPTPSTDLLAHAPEIIRRGPRAWPPVEIVDRTEEPPGSGLLGDRVRHAIRGTVRSGGTVFVYGHRRGYAAAVRCVSCSTIRRCPVCGSRPDPGEACRRCGTALTGCIECGGERFDPLGAGVGRLVAEIRRFVDPELVGPIGEGKSIAVGTERDLADMTHHQLVVLVDFDGLLYGMNFRAAEEALRIGARLASQVGSTSGHRLVVQTSSPAHHVVQALGRGDPVPAIEHELQTRRELGYPPYGQMVVIELRTDADGAAADADLRAAAGIDAIVMGPAVSRNGRRWIVHGPELGAFRTALRSVAGRWRDGGAEVRIDVDPIDV